MKETEVISEYEKKSLFKRIKEFFAKSNPQLLGFGEDEYVDMEVRNMLEVRNGISDITDPEKEKKFRAEIKKMIKGLLAKAKEEKSVDDEGTTKEVNEADSGKSDEDKKEEINKKKKEVKAAKKKTARNIDSKNIGYLDRLELLSQLKAQMYEDQIRKGADIPDEKDYYKMLLLQRSIEKDRRAYVKGLDKKGKAELLKVEEAYMSKDLEHDRVANAAFRRDLSELSRLNSKLNDINEWIEFKQREMREGIADPDEYSDELQAKQAEMTDTLLAIEKLDPSRLQKICDGKARQARMERVIMGGGYRAAVYKRSSDEMKEKLDYRTGKDKEQAYGTKSQNKFFRANLQEMIEQHRKHKKELEKELDKLDKSPKSLERRAELIKEICITTVKLNGFIENQDRVETVGVQNQAELLDDSKEVKKEIEKIEEHFDEIEHKLDTADKAAPVSNDRQTISGTILTGAVIAGAAAVMDEPHDVKTGATPVEEVDKEKSVPVKSSKSPAKSKGMLGEWQGAVNETYDEKAVEAHREREAALKELDDSERENGEMVRKLPNT